MNRVRTCIGVLAAIGLSVVAVPSATAAPDALSLSKPLRLMSTSDTGVKGNAASQAPDVSSTGVQIAFFSASTSLDPADTDTAFDVYVKDSSTGDLVVASTWTVGSRETA